MSDDAAGPPFVIRPLAPAEIDRVTAVLGLARLHQGDGFYLVAWEGEEPVGYADVGVRPRRVTGTVMIRTGLIEVDDTLLTWEKPVGRSAVGNHRW